MLVNRRGFCGACFATGIGLSLLGRMESLVAASDEPSEMSGSTRVTLRGKLETGIVAIGGETTGTQIAAGSVVFEIANPDDEEFRDWIQRLSGHSVVARGQLERKAGVEIAERWLVTLEQLAPAESDEAVVELELEGELNNEVFAIGGETTGTVLNTGSTAWELELSRNATLREVAAKLHGQQVFAHGVLETREGVEVATRRIVLTFELLEAGEESERAAVRGSVLIPDELASFANQDLELLLFEYDPRLADVGATQIDKLLMEGVSHEQGKGGVITFELGKGFESRLDRAYYVTCFVLENGNRTHIGELDGQPGLIGVLKLGQPRSLSLHLRAVR